ncbi:hypothetical protein TPHA_0G01310 [Tetrapisispora phaffii CBS 4417]|uniref:Double-strand break repair protein n=1 Tax=Tetrapisispora phaffii (strain ATCC 24235 / CBS 4417 / NBRC 1672 / NRRL Y-8282 / UCD 70-5) TaxID=1071381 RepID=G8BVP0_TETPH|nr:hypothetical protein TPHA_0G01310 [Tetrapisispora phaffii CBS 4417]CCE63968.1 hypothetical protein TPHA_0G01310 [Tetrapisispora phaffii CBS 4417]
MDYPDENTIRVLITTDNHVGYNENDPIAGDDSWKTFHEIMMLAKDNNVDMVLQAGDLFHVNKPSKKSMYQVMRSLRMACMGDKPCELELLNDTSEIFHYNEFTDLNYQDPNFNISIPVFGIAGNHDDASGDALLCPMDILQVSGLVNHFGKVIEADKIKVPPLLFKKGETKLALYGLASVRDERLFRTFKEGNVTFEVPDMEGDEWFNIMCVHQNHTGHTNTAFLPEQFLPGFLDMVIWGHEHECIPHLVHNPLKNFDVLQPGSSVATSLCDAEAQDKHVFILEVRKGEPRKLIPIPLKTTRPFIMRNITLTDVAYLRPHDKEGIIKYLVNEVEDMISEAKVETTRKLGLELKEEEEAAKLLQLNLPLIRLRVDYSGPEDRNSIIDYQLENPRRFSNRFVGSVANSNNIIQYHKKRKFPKKNTSNTKGFEYNENLKDNDAELDVQTLVNDMLNKMSLALLPEIGMNEAVKKFIEKDEKSALKDFIDEEIKNEVKMLASSEELLSLTDPEEIRKLIRHVKKAKASQDYSLDDDKDLDPNLASALAKAKKRLNEIEGNPESNRALTNFGITSNELDDIPKNQEDKPVKKSRTENKKRISSTKRASPETKNPLYQIRSLFQMKNNQMPVVRITSRIVLLPTHILIIKLMMILLPSILVMKKIIQKIVPIKKEFHKWQALEKDHHHPPNLLQELQRLRRQMS